MIKEITSEFLRCIPVDSLPKGGKFFKIEATEEERNALAKRFNLVSLDCMKAKIHLIPENGGDIIHLLGELDADIVQSCVATMKPVRSRIKESFERNFTATEPKSCETEVVMDAKTVEPPDMLIDGIIEIGECSAEQLALGIPPFPRLPMAVFNGFSSVSTSLDDESDSRGPFSELARIREKMK